MKQRYQIGSAITAVVFTVIPTLVNFYIPRLGFVFNLVPQWAFYISGGFLIGWSMNSFLAGFGADRTTVKGCVSQNKVVYRGRADYVDGDLVSVDVDPDPYCPQCQTRVNRDRIDQNPAIPTPSHGSKLNVWACPNCERSVKRENVDQSTIESIFRSHFEKIGNSDSNMHLSELVDRHQEKYDEEPSEEDIWKAYLRLTDEPHLSTDCFHNQ